MKHSIGVKRNFSSWLKTILLAMFTVVGMQSAWAINVRGSFNGWSDSQNELTNLTGTDFYVGDVNLSGGATFKIYNGAWYGGAGTVTSDNCTNLSLSDSGGNCSITISESGNYVFVWDNANHKLTVVYPVDGAKTAAQIIEKYNDAGDRKMIMFCEPDFPDTYVGSTSTVKYIGLAVNMDGWAGVQLLDKVGDGITNTAGDNQVTTLGTGISTIVMKFTPTAIGNQQANIYCPYAAGLYQHIIKGKAIAAPACTFYIKHPWNGGDWSFQQMTDNGDGTYSYIGKYGSSSNKGCNIATSSSGDNQSWYDSPTTVNNPQNGDDCVFTFTPSSACSTSGGTVTITKPSGSNYTYYLKRKDTTPTDNFHAMTKKSATTWELFEAIGTSSQMYIATSADGANEISYYKGTGSDGTRTMVNFTTATDIQGQNVIFRYINSGDTNLPAAGDTFLEILPGFANANPAEGTIDFGSHETGTNTDKSITFDIYGFDDIASVVISGTNADQWSKSDIDLEEITDYHNNGSMTVTFSPTSAGEKTATLTFTGTYGGQAYTLTYTLTGTATGSTCDLYLLHSFDEFGNTGDRTWKQMINNGDGTFTLEDRLGYGTREWWCNNINTTPGPAEGPYYPLNDANTSGNPTIGSKVIFTYTLTDPAKTCITADKDGALSITQVPYYIAGNITGIGWDRNHPMTSIGDRTVGNVNNNKYTITLTGVAVGDYEFQILEKNWRNEGGIQYTNKDAYLNSTNKSATLSEFDGEGYQNIHLKITEAGDYKITFDETTKIVSFERDNYCPVYLLHAFGSTRTNDLGRTWKQLQDNGDGTYTIEDRYGFSNTDNYYWCLVKNVADKEAGGNDKVYGDCPAQTYVGNPTYGSKVEFKYTSASSCISADVPGTLTITQIPYYLTGQMFGGDAGWNLEHKMQAVNQQACPNNVPDADCNIYQYIVENLAVGTYEFQIIEKNWRNEGGIQYTNQAANLNAINTSATLSEYDGAGIQNIHLDVAVEGNYIFTWNETTKKITVEIQRDEYYLPGPLGWGFSDENKFQYVTDGIYELTLHLTQNTAFKITDGPRFWEATPTAKEYGASITISDSNPSSELVGAHANAANVALEIPAEGDYTFTWNSNSHVISVNFPVTHKTYYCAFGGNPTFTEMSRLDPDGNTWESFGAVGATWRTGVAVTEAGYRVVIFDNGEEGEGTTTKINEVNGDHDHAIIHFVNDSDEDFPKNTDNLYIIYPEVLLTDNADARMATNIAWGYVASGTTDTKNLKLAYYGDLTNITVSLTGADAAEFSYVLGEAQAGAEYGSHVSTFDLSFTPTSDAAKAATLTISGEYNGQTWNKVYNLRGGSVPYYIRGNAVDRTGNTWYEMTYNSTSGLYEYDLQGAECIQANNIYISTTNDFDSDFMSHVAIGAGCVGTTELAVTGDGNDRHVTVRVMIQYNAKACKMTLDPSGDSKNVNFVAENIAIPVTNMYITGPAATEWGTWNEMTKVDTYIYKYHLNNVYTTGQTGDQNKFKFSNGNDIYVECNCFYPWFETDMTKCQGVSQLNRTSDWYSDSQIWIDPMWKKEETYLYVDTENKKYYVIAASYPIAVTGPAVTGAFATDGSAENWADCETVEGSNIYTYQVPEGLLSKAEYKAFKPSNMKPNYNTEFTTKMGLGTLTGVTANIDGERNIQVQVNSGYDPDKVTITVDMTGSYPVINIVAEQGCDVTPYLITNPNRESCTKLHLGFNAGTAGNDYVMLVRYNGHKAIDELTQPEANTDYAEGDPIGDGVVEKVHQGAAEILNIELEIRHEYTFAIYHKKVDGDRICYSTSVEPVTVEPKQAGTIYYATDGIPDVTTDDPVKNSETSVTLKGTIVKGNYSTNSGVIDHAGFVVSWYNADDTKIGEETIKVLIGGRHEDGTVMSAEYTTDPQYIYKYHAYSINNDCAESIEGQGDEKEFVTCDEPVLSFTPATPSAYQVVTITSDKSISVWSITGGSAALSNKTSTSAELKTIGGTYTITAKTSGVCKATTIITVSDDEEVCE